MKFLEDFKKFISKGNVFDMAIGVIIGGAFNKIVSSLVNDILMPFIGILTGKIDISKLTLSFPSSLTNGEPVIIQYGLFLQNILNFLIICFSIFLMINIFNKISKKHEAEKNISKASPEEILLKEIRDILKNK